MGNLSISEYLACPETVKFQGFNPTNLYQRISVIVHLLPHEIQRHLSLRHPHILHPVSVHQNILEYEIPPTSLASLIANRIPDNYFSESEILALLRGVASALAFLQENGISHGDITPETIFWDPKDSCYKILDNELLQGSKSGLQAFRARKRPAYLSPQYIQVARNEYVEANAPNKWKNDVYSLGLCILEMATFMAVSSCYDLHNLSANFPLAEKFFLLFKQNYEIEFAHYLKIMINSEEVARPDSKALFRIMLNIGEGKLPIQINDGISPLSWCYLRQQFKKGKLRNASFGENPLANFNSPPMPNQQYSQNHHNYNDQQYQRFDGRGNPRGVNSTPRRHHMIYNAEIQSDVQLDLYGNPIQLNESYVMNPKESQYFSRTDIAFNCDEGSANKKRGIKEIKDFMNKGFSNKTTLELEKKIDCLLIESDNLIRLVLSDPKKDSKSNNNKQFSKNSKDSKDSNTGDENKEK